jgi:thiamine-phosphate pyrophosphorylase
MIPRLHLVTDDRILARADFLSGAESLIFAGGEALAFHMRGPNSHGAELYRLARELRRLTAQAGTTFLVNDRVDLALALESDGVHLGRRSLPPSVARSLLDEGAVIGASVHGVCEAEEAVGDGADFLFVGTIFPTSSHPGIDGAGPGLIQEVRSTLPGPLVAIGGITLDAVGELLEAGAHGVAVMSGIWDAEDPEASLKGYLRALLASSMDDVQDG